MNRRRWFWAVQIGGWTAYGFSTFLTLLPALPAGVAGSYLTAKILRAAVGCGASLVLFLLYRWMRIRRIPVAAAVMGAIGACSALGAAWLFIYRGLIAPGLLSTPLSLAWDVFPRAALDLTFVLLAWSAAYFGVLQWERTREQQHRLLEAQRFAQEARFQVLSYQLKPHFLFNSLNSIRALINEDATRAKRMVTELADFLRYTLAREVMQPVRVCDEAEVIANYLAIETIRFDSRLHFAIDIDPRAAPCLIPMLLLHPLVENAVKHGMYGPDRPLRIRVSARRSDSRLCIEVANSGSMVSDPIAAAGNGTGTGWRAIRGRLDHLYPRDYRFDVLQDDGWVRVRVELPALGVDAPARADA